MLMVVYMAGISYDVLLEAYVDIMVHAFFYVDWATYWYICLVS